MSAREQREAASDAGLSKKRVVAEAVRLADRDGADGLSMRRLASELGAGAMSLYHYVANKEELLDAMIELALHPWAISLMESRTTPGPANLRHREAFTACLRKAGFSVLTATHANWLLNSYVYGHALQEASLPFDTADELAEMIENAYLPQLPPDEFPYLNESAEALAAAGYDPSEEFLFGLNLILTTLDPLRTSA